MKRIYLKDYQPHPFKITTAELTFRLDPKKTVVSSILTIEPNEAHDDHTVTDLILDGEYLKLISIFKDNQKLNTKQFTVTESQLIIHDTIGACKLNIEVEISPIENKALSGLYCSSNNFCTQCESHGFRRITYFIDRPDNLTCFTTHLIAQKDDYPVLLGNGNCTHESIDGDFKKVTWEDPTLKPCYLFAVVAGDYDHIQDQFVTMSGRKVTLGIYVEKGKLDQADFAMFSLKKAMEWDEKAYGREYDLDIYNVVGVSDFNFGAMENKGLNIFNSAVMLANSETALDAEYIYILRVIGHEYFHNWSGNRVTLKNWFQLSLKEGLTVFRDQHFTSDMTDEVVQRINEVSRLKTTQFSEDAGPMSHPVRPHSYISMNNFYTTTVYNKGAEVIGMMKTILGPEKFRLGMDHYFSENDGCAVTTDDFVSAMEHAGNIDLSQFKRWYTQAGTPEVSFSVNYDKTTQVLIIRCEQNTAPTADGSEKEPFVIPLVIGFVNLDHEPVITDPMIEQRQDSYILHLTMKVQEFKFEGVEQLPILSLNRNFSAPIKLKLSKELDTNESLTTIIGKDTDRFNRWDATQIYIKKRILELYHSKDTEILLDSKWIDALKSLLHECHHDGRFINCVLKPISAQSILIENPNLDILRINRCVHLFYTRLSHALLDEMKRIFSTQYGYTEDLFNYEDISIRSLKSIALYYIVLASEKFEIAKEYYNNARTMTDRWAALSALNHFDVSQRSDCLDDFYQRFHNDKLVVNKWLTMNALSDHESVFETVKQLTEHQAYDYQNPNNVRSLVGVFSDTIAFHRDYHHTYRWLSEIVLSTESFNPQLAARVAQPLVYFKLYDEKRRNAMIAELEYLNQKITSKDLGEVIKNSLSQVECSKATK